MKYVLCIPTRNVGKHLDKIFINIHTLHGLFENLIVAFSYDESMDNTLNKLQTFKKEYGNDCHILVNNEPLLKYRTHRLALARNKLVEFIKKYHQDADFFMMMDSDEICSYNIDVDVLEKSIECCDEWDALSFNRSGLPKGHENYDIWALLYEPFIHHCHSYNGRLDIVHIMRQDITKKLNSLKDDELFECYSAFNGFAIYKTNKFLNVSYDGETQKYFSDERIDDMLRYLRDEYNLKNLSINFDCVDNSHGGGKQICEHISFHINAIRKNDAKIRISGKKLFII